MRAAAFLLCCVFGIGPALSAEKGGSVFGSTEKSAGSMIGIFYDLKENQRRQPV